jgi:hypothetical protein
MPPFFDQQDEPRRHSIDSFNAAWEFMDLGIDEVMERLQERLGGSN